MSESSGALSELLALLSLERRDENLFRGQSQDLGWGTVYGGQVLGQALSAATQTVPPSRSVHSLQAYFLRPGDVSTPVDYEVDRIRDGGAFNTRRVVALQSGVPIFNLAASFQSEELGFEHQDAMPEAPAPETLPTEQERLEARKNVPSVLKNRGTDRSFDVRLVDDVDDLLSPSVRPPHRTMWFRTSAPLAAKSDSPALHCALLAYASDYAFVTTGLFPHGVTWLTPRMQVASVDHVMWFHRPFRIDDWLLHVIESPSASNARTLVRGRVFSRDGRLVASTAQEGLIRRRAAK